MALKNTSRRRRIRWLSGSIAIALALVFFPEAPLYSEVWMIRQYQRFISPAMEGIAHCRFQPTCSQYAIQVLQTDGFWIGNTRIAWRLLLCSPIGYVWERFHFSAAR
jgi:uncharacterized protein